MSAEHMIDLNCSTVWVKL